MNYLIIFIAFILYSLYTYIGYKDSIKNSNSYYVYGIIIVIISNLLWMYLNKTLQSKDSTLIYSLIWDIMIAVSAIIIPFFFFKMNLTNISYVGIVLIVVGLITLKLGLMK